jgi:hypothetical protein
VNARRSIMPTRCARLSFSSRRRGQGGSAGPDRAHGGRLRGQNIPAGYLLFSGEQHGFRKAENIKRALDAELYFYATNVFKIRLLF